MYTEHETGYIEDFDLQEFDIETFLKMSVSKNVSDIHLRVNAPPMVRRDGLMLKTRLYPLTMEEIKAAIEKVIPSKLKSKIETAYEIDFSVGMPGVSRFRVNIFRSLGGIGAVFRVIPYAVPTIDSLNLPPVLKNFTELNNGLVLVTGPTGSGKSTTLASMLDHLNQQQQKHIITIEDPIEFVYTNKKSVFTQRQLELDTDTFPNGLKYALRQDPDIILIGEMRDRETISSALKAAETGHLVFSTLHTTDAVQTINRIIDAFEPHEREPIRLQLASTLQGTIAQKLVRRANGSGRIATTEIMAVTPGIRDYIVRNEVEKIYEILKTNDFDGMMTMNMSLLQLVNAGLIKEKEALEASNNQIEMEMMLKGSFHGSSF